MPTFRPGNQRFKLVKTPSQAFTSNQPLPWSDAEILHPGGWSPGDPTRWHVPRSGLWLIGLSVNIATAPAAAVAARVRINGGVVAEARVATGSNEWANVVTLLDLVEGEVLTVTVHRSGSGSTDVGGGSSQLFGTRVGPVGYTDRPAL